jgi:ComF family protein
LVPIDSRTSCSGCLRPLPPGSSEPLRCVACRSAPPAYDRLLAVWRYQHPLSDAILALKFRRLDFLAGALAELALGREPFRSGEPYELVIPVPLSPLRRLSRGFNQAERIARCLGRHLRLPVCEALRRSDLYAAAQSRLGRTARQAAGAARRYRVPGRRREGVGLSGRRILLVDDVVTTGATLRAAAQALRDAGSGPVDGFALAATPAREWLRRSP